ncbi:hypothetical protein SLS54_002545 [Diplodia seriata]
MAIPRSSYYDKNYRQAPALIRARQPYLVKNIVTGAAIFSFAIGVCKLRHELLHALPLMSEDAFTIRAVAQDEFEDVKVPDHPARPPHASA